MICFLVSFCLIFFPACFMKLFFFRYCIIFSMFFFITWWLFPPSVSCRLTEKAAFLMSITASPSHHQCLTLTLALIFSQLPHPECWMPRLPLEAPPGCFWLALPAWFLVLALVSCLCVDAVCVLTLLFFLRSRGLLQQRCDTVVIWQLLLDYHSSCTFPFSSFCGSNFPDTQHTD